VDRRDASLSSEEKRSVRLSASVRYRVTGGRINRGQRTAEGPRRYGMNSSFNRTPSGRKFGDRRNVTLSSEEKGNQAVPFRQISRYWRAYQPRTAYRRRTTPLWNEFQLQPHIIQEERFSSEAPFVRLGRHGRPHNLKRPLHKIVSSYFVCFSLHRSRKSVTQKERDAPVLTTRTRP
jgi:hypothetical protein